MTTNQPNRLETGLGKFLQQYNRKRSEQKRKSVPTPAPTGFFQRLFGKKKEEPKGPSESNDSEFGAVEDQSVEEKIDRFVSKTQKVDASGTKKYLLSDMDLRKKTDPGVALGFVMKAILLPKFRYGRFSSIFMKFDIHNEQNYAYLFELFFAALTALYNTGEIENADEIYLKPMLKTVFGVEHLDSLIDAGVKYHQIVINDTTTLQSYFTGG